MPGLARGAAGRRGRLHRRCAQLAGEAAPLALASGAAEPRGSGLSPPASGRTRSSTLERPGCRRHDRCSSHRHNPRPRRQTRHRRWLVAVRAPGSRQRPTPPSLARIGRPPGSLRVQIDPLGAVLTAPPHTRTCTRNGGDARACHPTADHAPRSARAGTQTYQTAADGPQGRVPGLPLGVQSPRARRTSSRQMRAFRRHDGLHRYPGHARYCAEDALVA